MGLQFIGEVGVYMRDRDAVKILAADGDRIIECYVQRSALDAVGCPGPEEGAEFIRYFQEHRATFEIAAMVKYRRALKRPVELQIDARDLAAVLPASAA